MPISVNNSLAKKELSNDQVCGTIQTMSSQVSSRLLEEGVFIYIFEAM